jgi:PadR family transcriptional regulator PadR
MSEKTDVWQGTLALMVLKTLEALGSLHGYGIARRIEQTSENKLAINYGTIYPALLKLEQEGYIASEWLVWRRSTVRSDRRCGKFQVL